MNFGERHFPGKAKTLGILGVPLGYGAGKLGSELATNAIRTTRFRGKRLTEHLESLGYKVMDHGDVEVLVPASFDDEISGDIKYKREVVESSKKMSQSVLAIFQAGEIPVILGGDHSIAAGTFSGSSKFFRDGGEELGLLWFDAHADMNTAESSPSGNSHGMPLATLLGHGAQELTDIEGFAPKIKPELCAHIGGRDLDLGEKRLIDELGMRDNFFTMSDIDRRGMLDCVMDALEIVSKASAGFAVTFDVDIVDPRFAPGSGTLVRGGVTMREAHLALEIVAENGGMRSFEIVEVNPLLDRANITIDLAAELILSVFGNSIL